MSLLEDVMAGLRKALDAAREKGEMGVQIARLRIELVTLGREREALYNRLGRLAYHDGNDRTTLEPVIAEIDRVSAELTAREETLRSLGQPLEEPSTGGEAADTSRAGSSSGSSSGEHARMSASAHAGAHANMTVSDAVIADAALEPADPTSTTGETARDAAAAFENQGPSSAPDGQGSKTR